MMTIGDVFLNDVQCRLRCDDCKHTVTMRYAHLLFDMRDCRLLLSVLTGGYQLNGKRMEECM